MSHIIDIYLVVFFSGMLLLNILALARGKEVTQKMLTSMCCSLIGLTVIAGYALARYR